MRDDLIDEPPDYAAGAVECRRRAKQLRELAYDLGGPEPGEKMPEGTPPTTSGDAPHKLAWLAVVHAADDLEGAAVMLESAPRPRTAR